MTFKSDDEDDADDDDREGKSAKIILKSLDDRTEKDLRSLNECLFPVRYNVRFRFVRFRIPSLFSTNFLFLMRTSSSSASDASVV
jgi:hypothetical protein